MINKFLYYVPGRISPFPTGPLAKNATPEDKVNAFYRECGFEHLIGTHTQSGEVQGGPDGKSGVVFVAHQGIDDGSMRCGYYPDAQTWLECDSGKWWLGWFADRPPSAEDLARVEQAGGHETDLPNSPGWVVPVARGLESNISLDRDGKLVMTPLPKFAPFMASLEKIMPIMLGETEMGWGEFVDLIASILGVNYRVSRWELAALGVLTTESLWTIASMAIDYPRMEEMLAAEQSASKKNRRVSTLASSGTGAGVTDSSPDTSQQGQTS